MEYIRENPNKAKHLLATKMSSKHKVMTLDHQMHQYKISPRTMQYLEQEIYCMKHVKHS